jgi:hypothetical protein
MNERPTHGYARDSKTVHIHVNTGIYVILRL